MCFFDICHIVDVENTCFLHFQPRHCEKPCFQGFNHWAVRDEISHDRIIGAACTLNCWCGMHTELYGFGNGIGRERFAFEPMHPCTTDLPVDESMTWAIRV
jgi:hypothetical protein